MARSPFDISPRRHMPLAEVDDDHRQELARNLSNGSPERAAALARLSLLDVAIAGIGAFGVVCPSRQFKARTAARKALRQA
jgi:hypothetical protein